MKTVFHVIFKYLRAWNLEISVPPPAIINVYISYFVFLFVFMQQAVVREIIHNSFKRDPSALERKFCPLCPIREGSAREKGTRNSLLQLAVTLLRVIRFYDSILPSKRDTHLECCIHIVSITSLHLTWFHSTGD